MSKMRTLPFCFLAFLVGCGDSAKVSSVNPAAPVTEVTLKSVKWPDLEKAIAAHKGRVVVVDMWADYCIPCKKAMPHMVEMQSKYRDQGWVCMSLSADEKDDVAKALTFLKKIDAKIENYHWLETLDEMEKQLGATAFPTVVVYGRDGKKAKVFTNQEPFDHTDVEKFVKSILK